MNGPQSSTPEPASTVGRSDGRWLAGSAGCALGAMLLMAVIVIAGVSIVLPVSLAIQVLGVVTGTVLYFAAVEIPSSARPRPRLVFAGFLLWLFGVASVGALLQRDLWTIAGVIVVFLLADRALGLAARRARARNEAEVRRFDAAWATIRRDIPSDWRWVGSVRDPRTGQWSIAAGPQTTPPSPPGAVVGIGDTQLAAVEDLARRLAEPPSRSA